MKLFARFAAPSRRLWAMAVIAMLVSAAGINANASSGSDDKPPPSNEPSVAILSVPVPVANLARASSQAIALGERRLIESALQPGCAYLLRAINIGLFWGRPNFAWLRLVEPPAESPLRVKPVQGSLSSSFGLRRDPLNRRRHRAHQGIDLVAARHTPVVAAGDGWVVRAERARGYGLVVYIDHGRDLETRYAHLQHIEVQPGDMVSAGQPLGSVGSSGRATGPHLHFEVRHHGHAIAPEAIPGLGLTRSPETKQAEQSPRPHRHHHETRAWRSQRERPNS